jgi:hypothetical protein
MMSLKGMLTDLGLRTDDEPGTVPASLPPQPAVAPVPVVPVGNADPNMVQKLKTTVLGASPVIGQFMQNVELVRPQFPGDETASMKAALAFTRVDKATLSGELSRTVAAAFLHTKNSMETQRQQAHGAAVGSLETELATVNHDIQGMQAQVVELQQSIASKQAAAVELQAKMQTAEADLRQQDDVIKASFGQVEQYIALLRQTIEKL